MKKAFTTTLLLFLLLLVTNCFATVFTWVDVISENRDPASGGWYVFTDVMVDPVAASYTATYAVSDGGPSGNMGYYLETWSYRVFYSGPLTGNPTFFDGKTFTWSVNDGTSTITASGTVPTGVVAQVPLSMITGITGNPYNPTISWSNTANYLDQYRIRVVYLANLTDILWEADIVPDTGGSANYTIPTDNPITPTIIEGITLLPGVDYVFRIEAIDRNSLSDMTGSSRGAFWNRSTTFVNYTPPVPIELSPRYRLYNPNSGHHHYTTNSNEYSVLGSLGWAQEGMSCYLYNDTYQIGAIQTAPYYRLYNPNSGEHHWTTDANEYQFLGTIGWRQEGVDGHVFASQVTGSQPLYRLYNPNAGLHHWTMDANERSVIIGYGWKDEGIACYVFP